MCSTNILIVLAWVISAIIQTLNMIILNYTQCISYRYVLDIQIIKYGSISTLGVALQYNRTLVAPFKFESVIRETYDNKMISLCDIILNKLIISSMFK